jgi:hypothetical protein
MDRERYVESIEGDVAVHAAFDVEYPRRVADALGRPRGEGCRFRYEARAYDVAIAVLEIVALKVPPHLLCHRSLLLRCLPVGPERVTLGKIGTPFQLRWVATLDQQGRGLQLPIPEPSAANMSQDAAVS